MVKSDIPISNKNEDLLNRSKFCEKLAESILDYTSKDPINIGLVGDWGSGKTSIINMILESIDEKLKKNYLKRCTHKRKKHAKIAFKKNKIKEYIIIKFNPWFFSNQKNLYVQFFKTLIENITKYEYDKIPLLKRTTKPQKSLFKKLRIESLEEYLDYLQINKTLPYHDTLVDETQVESYKSLLAHKQLCEEYFKSSKYKIIVIIDDIDRLVDDEIKQVFTLVKSLADFPNIIYILAFDEKPVNHALSQWVGDNQTEEFIDKIVQVPLAVPQIDYGDIFNIFRDKFDELITKYELEQELFNLMELYLLIYPYFENIRKINRFCNALDFYLYSMSKEIWIYDFALLTALQVFEKSVYDEIKSNKDLLVGHFNDFMKYEEQIGHDKQKLNTFLEPILNNDKIRHEPNVRHILSDLFPKVNYALNCSFTSNFKLELKRKKCGVMLDEYFDLYFTFDNTNRLSQSRIQLIITSANEDKESLKSNLFSIKKINLVDSLINQLTYHYDSFDEVGIFNLINVLTSNYKILFEKDYTESETSKISKSIIILIDLIKKNQIYNENLVNNIIECENNYYKTELILRIVNENYLSGHLNSKLKSSINEFLEEYFENTEFYKIEHVRSFVWFWRDLSDFNTTNNYISNLNDEDLITFIFEFIEHKFNQNEYEIRYDYLSHIVDTKSIKIRFENMKHKEKLYNEQKQYIDLFIDNYPEK